MSRNIFGARPWPFRVTYRHRPRDHSIRYMPFPIGDPLEPSLHLKPFSKYGPTRVNKRTNQPTSKQTRRIAIPPGKDNKLAWSQYLVMELVNEYTARGFTNCSSNCTVRSKSNGMVLAITLCTWVSSWRAAIYKDARVTLSLDVMHPGHLGMQSTTVHFCASHLDYRQQWECWCMRRN